MKKRSCHLLRSFSTYRQRWLYWHTCTLVCTNTQTRAHVMRCKPSVLFPVTLLIFKLTSAMASKCWSLYNKNHIMNCWFWFDTRPAIYFTSCWSDLVYPQGGSVALNIILGEICVTVRHHVRSVIIEFIKTDWYIYTYRILSFVSRWD